MSRSVGDELDARLDALATRIAAAIARAEAWLEPIHVHVGAEPAQRCQALEDRIVELEAALVGARDLRARAEAKAESARREANAALDELEQLRSSQPQRETVDLKLGEALQARLLEIERLTRERDSLRSTCDELRGRTRELRRERDETTLGLERAHSQIQELREREAGLRNKLTDCERIIDTQRRELEQAERRARHMRAHLATHLR